MRLSTLQEKAENVPGLRSFLIATLLVLSLGCAVTVWSWYSDRNEVNELKQSQLTALVKEVESTISERFRIYEEILHGGAGLFVASDNVTREEWNRFVAQYNIENRYPGVLAIGYAEYIPASSLAAYTDSQRAIGPSNFTVTPVNDRAEYTAVRFIEPYEGTNAQALGYDMFTEPTMRAAMAAARDTGLAALSGRLILMQDDRTYTPGFVMYVPLYRGGILPSTPEERLQNLQGYVFAAFRANDFFSEALAFSDVPDNLQLQAFDGNELKEDFLIYESPGYDPGHLQTANFQTNVVGRDWAYQFVEPEDLVSEGEENRPRITLLGGIVLSVTVSGFLFLMMLTRSRDIVYAKQQEAQQAKDDLLSLASHQLRTPATSVKQYLGMVLEGYTGKVSTRHLPALRKAYTSNERQLDIINQILYVAKADAGRVQIHKERFELIALVEDVISDLMDMFEERHQKLSFSPPKKRIYIKADKHTLRMVIENLLTNASKYSYENNKITVKVGEARKEVFVSVKDEGVGIDPADFDKLFEKFSRIDNELSTQAGGSGIGLYIDKALVELHDGYIEVESELGQGSIFTAHIPKERR